MYECNLNCKILLVLFNKFYVTEIRWALMLRWNQRRREMRGK